jgi:hypothetical protein
MPGLVPGIHVLKRKQTQRRGWPGHPRDEVPGGGHDQSEESVQRAVGITPILRSIILKPLAQSKRRSGGPLTCLQIFRIWGFKRHAPPNFAGSKPAVTLTESIIAFTLVKFGSCTSVTCPGGRGKKARELGNQSSAVGSRNAIVSITPESMAVR